MIVGYIFVIVSNIFLGESERRYGSDGNRDVRNVAAGCGLAFVGELAIAGVVCWHGGVCYGRTGGRCDRVGDWCGQGQQARAGDCGRAASEDWAGPRYDPERVSR